MSSDEVDGYLDGFPPEVRAELTAIRETIAARLPDAEEVISYGIPTFRLGGRNVVHYAGWAKHVSVYPVPEPTPDVAGGIATYRAGKGTLKFPLGEPLPLDLIARVVDLLVEQRHDGPVGG